MTVEPVAEVKSALLSHSILSDDSGALDDNEDDCPLDKPQAHIAIPNELLSFPVPILNEVSEWIETFARQTQPQITMVATLALASTLCGRMYCSTEQNTTSLYLMVLGETGVGKNYAKTSIQQFFNEVEMTHLLGGSGNTSAGAVFTQLIKSPCHIQIIDEIGKQLQAARKSGNGQMAEAFSTMVEAYSSTTAMITPKSYSNMGNIARGVAVDHSNTFIHYPAITLLGLATPRQVYDNLSTGDIEDGFLNRLIVADITLPQEPKQRRGHVKAPLPDHINQWARLIRQPLPTSRTDLKAIEVGYDQDPHQIEVELTDDALDVFWDYEKNLDDKEKRGDFILPDMTRRWNENAMRVATCLAVCQNALEPIITAELAQWAIKFVGYYGNEFMLNASTQVADSPFHRLYLKVEGFIKRAKEKGLTERRLSKNCRQYQETPPNQRDQVMTALLRERKIHQVAGKRSISGQVSAPVWMADEYMPHNLLSKNSG